MSRFFVSGAYLFCYAVASVKRLLYMGVPNLGKGDRKDEFE